ncbi:MAG TPA: hypothetical protein VII23_24255, partial [Terriglobales bacterium]
RLTLSEWLSYATMAIRGPRCVEPSVLARERPSDRLHGLELSCISEGLATMRPADGSKRLEAGFRPVST